MLALRPAVDEPTMPAALRHTLAILLTCTLLAFVPYAMAKTRTCEGPGACCPSEVSATLPTPASVQLGVLIVGLHAVDEKVGTWSADFYLTESWNPKPGFSPETEIANEVARLSEQFDTIELSRDQCIRSRRIRSTFQNAFNLRRFPLDRQVLVMEFSDAWFASSSLEYTSAPSVSALDQSALDQVTSWKIEGALRYRRYARSLQEANGASQYDYARFELPVRRHLTYHLTKFFLPLLVIVAVSLALFWIDPADIGSRVSIGVTCLLAAIAFQLADASNLAEVEYLTLADRVYASCYVFIAASLVMAIYQNSLIRRGMAELARRWDRRSRIGFPLGVLTSVALSFARAYTQVN